MRRVTSFLTREKDLPQSIAVSDLVSDAASVAAAPPQSVARGRTLRGFHCRWGATWIEEDQAFNFAVCAEHAESVKLFWLCAGL